MIIGFDGSRAFGLERTGTENYSCKLLEALERVDSRNSYVVYTRGKISGKGERKFGKFENFSFKNIGWSRLWTQGGLALQTWRDKLDVLFVPAHTLPVLRCPGLATVVTIHGLEYEYLPEYHRFPQNVYLTWSTRYAARFASRLISVSEFTKEDLVKRLGARREKIKVIHEGVDILVYSKAYSDKVKHRLLEKLYIKRPYVLFVGVVQPRKNLVRLIEGFSKVVLSKKFSDKTKGTLGLSLVIAGKKGWMYDEIMLAPKKFGVEDRVKFLGFVKQEDLVILFQEAELYIQPSLTEGFGLPVLEAMAAGTPVVASREGALPEVVGKAGLLIDPLSCSEMADAMKLVLTSKELREGLRERGLGRVKEFTWEKAAKRTVEVLERAVLERP